MKVFLGSTLGSYSISGGTRNITCTLPFAHTITKQNILAIINETQKVTYFKADGSVDLVSGITLNVITLNGSVNVLQSTDLMLIVMELPDILTDFINGGNKVFELDPAKGWYDTVQTLVTTQAITNTWAAVGVSSEITAVDYNFITLYVSINHALSTDIQLKVKRRYILANANTFDDMLHCTGNVTNKIDETDGSVIIEFNEDVNATRTYAIEIPIDNTTPSLEFHIKCNGTLAGSPTITVNYIRSWTATNPSLTYNKIISNNGEIFRDLKPEVIANATNLSVGTFYYPSSNGFVLSGVKDLSCQFVSSTNLTITFEVSDELTSPIRWVDITPMALVIADNTASPNNKHNNSGYSSFTNETNLKVDWDNINAYRWRMKVVVGNSTNSIYASLKMKGF